MLINVSLHRANRAYLTLAWDLLIPVGCSDLAAPILNYNRARMSPQNKYRKNSYDHIGILYWTTLSERQLKKKIKLFVSINEKTIFSCITNGVKQLSD